MRYKNLIVFSVLGSTFLLFLVPKQFVDRWYGQVLYPIVRVIYALLTIIPFPLVYLILLVVLVLIGLLIKSSASIWSKWKKFGIGFVFILALFYLLWAFNYRRPSFGHKFPLEKIKLDSITWHQELNWAYEKLLKSRPADLKVYTASAVEQLVADNIKEKCNEFGYSIPGKVKVKDLWPKGFLLKLRTAGFYLPYAGEGYIDAGLHFIQKPFTAAHELCHGYGVTDEGACNLLAYLAIHDHVDSTIQYSAHMGYYRYVAAEYRYRMPYGYHEFRKNIDKMVASDLDSINANTMQYKEWLPGIRDNIYNSYLTMQGIEEGMASYDNIIGYVRMYREAGEIQ